MRQHSKNILFPLILVFSLGTWISLAKPHSETYFPFEEELAPGDTIPKKRKRTTHPDPIPEDRRGDPFANPGTKSPFELKDPDVVQKEVEIDPSLDHYTVDEKVGNLDYRAPSEMTFEEFYKMKNQEMMKNYWKNKNSSTNPQGANKSQGPFSLKIPVRGLEGPFGSNFVDIRPTGLVTLDFGGKWQRVYNPALTIRQQKNGVFDFNEQITMNVVGKIGEKLKITANWDTKAAFEFQNNIKVQYTAFEEDIIQGIEVGRVSMPLNSSLINGAQNLFGIKTKLKFGRMTVTSVLARQDGKVDEMVIQGGTQGRSFEIQGYNYEDYRHFFLGQFFRENYERSLQHLPVINSGVKITRVEVYVTNRSNSTTDLKNFIAYLDLGEGRPYNSNVKVEPYLKPPPLPQLTTRPSNDVNSLFATASNHRNPINAPTELGSEYINGTDYAIVNSARKLDPKDFDFHTDLGYISLRTPLRTDEVLAVSYEYSYNGQTHKVGELQEDYANLDSSKTESIILKMLKPFTIKLDLPSWNLMMKNIYNVGATQLTQDNFQMRIIYKDDLSGSDLPNLQEGTNTKDVPLIRLSGLDNLNPNNDPSPDGNFDYVEHATVDSRNGRIMFPVLEPFGSHLESKFTDNEADLKSKYVFTELYASTKQYAQQQASHNKFYLTGRYQASSSSEIVLPGINIAPGSVVVIVGSNQLTEGVDYTIDYTLGRLKITNDGALSSGQEIRIRFEKQDLFNFRRKSFYGTRFDYQVNKDFIIGGTLLQQNEAPQISRVNIGDEPSKNTVWGVDVSYNRESRKLTKLVDKLPFIDTKAPSTVTAQGEFAQMIPGHNKKINQDGANGIAFIDDFEGSKTPYDISKSPTKWRLAATPQRFAESASNTLDYTKNRAKLAWYNVDNVFYREPAPSGFNKSGADSNIFERAIYSYELFKGQYKQAVNVNLTTFDLAFFPDERGPYNYNTSLTSAGKLPSPTQSWAGVTRYITNDIDFDNANIQYIEFWMMNPYSNANVPGTIAGQPFDPNNSGKLYFNLGEVSEDIMKDGRRAFENGLPTSDDQIAGESVSNIWGRVTTNQFVNNAFSNDAGSRSKQDVGLDGASNADEAGLFFKNYLTALSASARALVQDDPSADDFKYYLGDNQSGKTIIERYKDYNGLENNSPTNSGGSFTPSNSSLPDDEDVNQDNTLNSLEEYYEYEVSIENNKFVVGQNFIVSTQKDNAGADWYQFRIPIRSPTTTVGEIQGYKSIRFLRMYMAGFKSPVVLRTANMQLVANQWRAYQSDNINQSTVAPATEPDDALIDVSTVNVEENGIATANSSPYVVPPNFIRDQDITSTVNRKLNEQSLRLCVNNLQDKNSRAVYKNVSYDFLNYGNVNMFIHAESDDPTLKNAKASAFLRIGTDFVDNYYEIEVPLYLTNPKDTYDPYAIWRGENEINVAINELINTKLERTQLYGTSSITPYTRSFDGKYLTVVGKPDISAVLTVMIGLKNPGDDNLPHSFCIWADELRVTNFNEKSGWAATGKINMKLADFGNLTGTARFIGAGFGSLEQKVSQRQRNNTLEWGVAGNFSLDKFLPKKLGLKLPMYVGYNKKTIMPQYDPLNPDVLLKQELNVLPDQNTRNEYKKLVIDQTTSRAINFTNIQKIKTKTGGKNHFYDIENLKLTIGYNDMKQTNYQTKEYSIKEYKGGLGYDFTNTPKSYEPFKESKLFKSKYLRLVKDFNFTPMPNMFTFRTDFDRKITKSQYYQSGPLSDIQPALYQKYFTINRTYGTSWNMTKNLTANYKANSYSMVDEPYGEPIGKEYNHTMFNNMFLHGFGRLKTYNQMTDINYKLPLDKIPLTDFLNTEYRYGAGYTWTSGPLGIKDSLGNVVQNTRDQTVNGKIDLNKLYNKNKFLKEVNTPTPRRRNIKPDPNDTTNKPQKDNKVLKAALRTVMLVKSLNLTYNVAEGTQLTGYMNKPSIFGIDDASNTGALLPFVLGSQDPNFRFEAANQGWISRSRALNTPFTQFRNQTVNVRTSVEPTQDLRIQLDAMVKKGTTFQELFRIDTLGNNYVSDNPLRSGNHSISMITILTAFNGKDSRSSDPNSSSTFSSFQENRKTIASRVGSTNLNSQEVLIPAFLAAYKGQKATSINLTPTPQIPLPNWNITFTGLTKIPALKKNFQSISISHGYSSVYTVGNYTSSLQYNSNYIKPGNDFLSTTPTGNILSPSGSVIPVYIINEVNIRESFSPLIGINIRTKGKWTYRAEYRRSRNLSLSLTNAQMRDETSQDFVFGIGYVKTGVQIPKIFTRGKTKTLKNELNVRVDFTLRDSKGVQRNFDQSSTVTAGNVNWQLKPTITYNLSSRVTLQFYFERTSQNPKISSSFKRTTTSAGIQLRFTLS